MWSKFKKAEFFGVTILRKDDELRKDSVRKDAELMKNLSKVARIGRFQGIF